MKRREVAQTLIASATAGVLVSRSVDANAIGEPHHSRTAAEIAAGVTPSNFSYPELNILRYGAPINSGDAAAALGAAVSVLMHHVEGELLIPAGYSFNLSQVLFRSLSKFNIRCDGVVVSIAAQPGSPYTDQRHKYQGRYSPFRFDGCTQFKLYGKGHIQPGYVEPMHISGCHDFDISIDCRGIGANSTLSGIYIQSCSRFVLHDMVIDSITAQDMNDSTEVYYNWLNNVQLLDSCDFRISEVLTRKSGMNGVWVGSNCRDFDISDNIFEYNAGSGIQITWGGYGVMPVRYKINNNTFRYNQADGLDNPNTTGKGTVNVFAQFNNNLHIYNGWINCDPTNSPGADGSGVGTFYGIAKFVAVGNVVVECASWGIFCDQCDDFTLSANTVQKNHAGTVNGGMYISMLNSGRFTGNDIAVPATLPALNMHSCSDVTISECAFSGLVSIANGTYSGCKMSACKFDCSNVVIVQFDLLDCNVAVRKTDQDGLYIGQAGVTLDRNVVSAPGHAIVVSSVNYCKITSNIATSTGDGAGIYVAGAAATTIRGNRGSGISGPGIHVTGSSTHTELTMNQASSSTGNSFLIDEGTLHSIKYGNVTIAGVAKFGGGYDINY
jgi:parallel beta-helix repeat protein